MKYFSPYSHFSNQGFSVFCFKQKGVTLIECILFISVVSIALAILMKTFDRVLIKIYEPLERQRALVIAEKQISEIIVHKNPSLFDKNPSVDVPGFEITVSVLSLNLLSDTPTKYAVKNLNSASNRPPLVVKGRQPKKINVQVSACLLYTSPSPRDRG